MAEVYSDKPGHRSATSWIILAIVAVIALAIIISLVR